MAVSTAALNVQANALASAIGKLSAHSGDPGPNGTNNELAGGSPAYARKVPTWLTAVGGVANLSAPVTFDVAAGSVVNHVGAWSSDGLTYYGSTAVDEVTFGTQNTYVLTGLSATDIAG